MSKVSALIYRILVLALGLLLSLPASAATPQPAGPEGTAPRRVNLLENLGNAFHSPWWNQKGQINGVAFGASLALSIDATAVDALDVMHRRSFDLEAEKGWASPAP